MAARIKVLGPEEKADRLDLCGAILAGTSIWVALLVLFFFFDAIVGPRMRANQQARHLCRNLSLSSLALVPSGRSRRNPEMLIPGIDLRFTPALFRIRPEPIESFGKGVDGRGVP
jgi:hypothetical protein